MNKSTAQYLKENERKFEVVNKDNFCITIQDCMKRKGMTRAQVYRAMVKGRLDFFIIETPRKRYIFVVINKKYTDLRKAQFAPFDMKGFLKFMDKFMTKSNSHSRRV